MLSIDQNKPFLLAKELYRTRCFDQAIALFSQLAKTFPTEPDIWRYLGLSFHYLQQYTQAEDAFSQLITHEPNNPWNFFLRGQTKYAQHRYHDAIDDLNHAEELELQDEEFYGAGSLYDLFLTRAACHEQCQQFDDALADYQQFSHYSGRHYVYEREKKRLRWKILWQRWMRR